MTTQGTQTKFTEAQVKEHIQRIEKVVEKNRTENRGEHFTSVTPDEIEKKLKRVNSPMIVSQGWGSAAPGGTINYSLGIYNPDPTQAIWLFAHVWVGSGNIDPTVGTFLQNIDTRFPRLTEPTFSGLTLAAGASTTLNFSLVIPATVERTNYLGNSCLMRFNWHDVGTYLDRGIFVFRIV
ncbi:MAG: hypothetical protein FJZ79_10190 [Chlorobi bacterium]|nr:hypothetical protein [Chlorobiota bacterium]